MQSKQTAEREPMAKGQNKQAKSKRKKRAKKQLAEAQAAFTRLQQERDLAVSKLKELEALLEQLPDVFERKFSQRLAPVLERQKLLIQENEHLRAQVAQLMKQLGTSEMDFPQPSTQANIAFIGLKPASTSSFDPLSEEHVDEPIAADVLPSQRQLNAA